MPFTCIIIGIFTIKLSGIYRNMLVACSYIGTYTVHRRKLLHEAVYDNDGLRCRLEVEAQAIARLQHPVDHIQARRW